MSQIEIRSNQADRIPLGRFIEFQMIRESPDIETRFFLKHDGLFYLKPLKDWSRESELTVFPEAPGRYVLVTQWRSPGGGGWLEKGFEVVTAKATSAAPYLLKLRDEARLWVPTEWEARVLQDSEGPTLAFLKSIIEPGMVVYDLGANLGVYSVLMAKWTGPEGHVYSVEANPVCLSFLKTNVALNRLTNVEILPAAVLDRPGEIGFSINYGNSNLGLAEETHFFDLKPGHEIRVACYELDRLVRDLPLLSPHLIKLDVEGAERAAVRGMRETLERLRPIMVMELHGYENAARTLEILDGLRYSYTDPATRETFGSTGEVCEKLGAGVFQLVAFP